jgi:hypothetical protein
MEQPQPEVSGNGRFPAVDIKIVDSSTDDSGPYLIATTNAAFPWGTALGDTDSAVIGFGASETEVLISPPSFALPYSRHVSVSGSNHAGHRDGAVEMEIAAPAQSRDSKR